jgi:hypothetical protein
MLPVVVLIYGVITWAGSYVPEQNGIANNDLL